MLLFQLCNLSVHLRTGKEINDSLFVLRHKLLERSFIRSLYSQDSLRSSIHILRIFKLRLGINILYISDNNVTNQL